MNRLFSEKNSSKLMKIILIVTFSLVNVKPEKNQYIVIFSMWLNIFRC